MGDTIRVRLDKAGYVKALAARSRPRDDWTNQRVADRLDINNTLLSHFVNGRREIPYSQAVRIADLLWVTVGDIIDEESIRCPTCGTAKAAA